jgi:hypothetical protein
MTNSQLLILEKIKKLDNELKTVVAEIEKENKKVIVKYNKKTNKDELFIKEV